MSNLLKTNYLLSEAGSGPGHYDFLNAFVLGSLPVTFVTGERCPVVVTYQPPVKHLPLAWILGQKDRNCTLAGVMTRLWQFETREPNLHFKSDYRQAWITCSFLQKGLSDAFVKASYRMYGLHPDKVWPAIVADRKARLCDEYFTWYTSDDVLRPDVPKIPHNTADADTHAANGASYDDWDIAGLVPQERKLV